MTHEKHPLTPQKILLGLAAPTILTLAALLTSIPRPLDPGDPAQVPAPIFYTSLADTISPEFVQQIGIGGDVTGIRFVPLRGIESRYFRYQANPDDVLHALSLLPFRIGSIVADTGVRVVSAAVVKDQINTLSALEYERSRFFWDASSAFTAYQLERDHTHHLILIDPVTREILHRVSYG